MTEIEKRQTIKEGFKQAAKYDPIRNLQQRGVLYTEGTIKFLLEYGISEDEILWWHNNNRINEDSIKRSIDYVKSTNESGLNFSQENANAIRQQVALNEDMDQFALIPAIAYSTRQNFNFLEYTQYLRNGRERETYRTETDMSIMVSVTNNALSLKRETTSKNFQYKDKDGVLKDNWHTYDVITTTKGKFVLSQPVKNDDFGLKLFKEIQDFKDSGNFGIKNEETLTFLTPVTNGGHWTLSVCHVSFPKGDLLGAVETINSLNDERQNDAWSCGIHTMEAAYSLITGAGLETAKDNQSIEQLYPNIMKVSDERVNIDQLKEKSADAYIEDLGKDYIKSELSKSGSSVDGEVAAKAKDVKDVLSELEIKENIGLYSEELLEDRELMKDVIANIIQAHKEGKKQMLLQMLKKC